MYIGLILGVALAENPPEKETTVVDKPTKHQIMISSMQWNSDGYSELGADRLNTPRISYAYRLTPNIAVTAGWSYGRIETSWSDYDYNTFQSGFDHHMLNLGARYQYPLASWLEAYVGLDGLAGYGGMLFTDDLRSDDPLTTNNSSAMNFGGVGTLGILARMSISKDVPELLLGFSFGYALQTPMEFSNSIGELQMTGNFSQFSVGAAF